MPVGNEEIIKRYDEIRSRQTGWAFDLFKHLTTLASAIIVFIATFKEKLSPIHLKWLLPVSIICFLICIVMAILAAIFHLSKENSSGLFLFYSSMDRKVPGLDERKEEHDNHVSSIEKLLTPTAITAWLSFVFGIACLGILVIANL